MQTNVTKTVEVKVESDSINLEYFDDKTELLNTIESGQEEKYAELLKCSPKLIETLLILVEDIRDNLGMDLRDIWERLDRIEGIER